MATTNDCLDASGEVQASTSAFNGTFVARDEGKEEYPADVLVKFLMSRNISLDVINDSQFQNLVKSIAQHGQKSCDLLENSTVIEKSLWKFEHEIKLYMRMVTESWKTTGCSVMSYNLRGGKRNRLVLGFYCPKGFIFLEVFPSEEEIQKAVSDLVPYSSCDVLQFVRHDPCCHSECQYQALDHSNTVCMSFAGGDETKCIRQQIQVLWRSICEESKWVKNLIKKSDDMYDYIVTSDLYEMFYTTLKRKGVAQVAGWRPASSFSRLVKVMKMEFELKAWLSQLSKNERFRLENDTNVATVINNREFWGDGNELLRVLTPFFKIPSLMDTLVPTAGYLELAIYGANDLLKSYSEREPLKYKGISDCFDKWIYCFHSAQSLASYFNPCYILREDVQENIRLDEYAEFLYLAVYAFEEDEKEPVDAEIEAYCFISSNPFANISRSECKANHPLTLWSKYGDAFPLLQKCAYKYLSKPACCLCKQVEKHIIKLGGSDNYILRLNGLMMEEFTKMGDGIYQPILI